MLNNDNIMAGICHNSAANFIHGSDTEAHQCRQTSSSGVAIFTLYCSFSSSLYARLERTENPSISVLKTQQCQCVPACFWRFSQPNWPHKKRPDCSTDCSASLEAGAGRRKPDPSRTELAECFYRLQWEPSRSSLSQNSLNPFFSSPRKEEKMSRTWKNLYGHVFRVALVVWKII